jgi:hypothetical protein
MKKSWMCVAMLAVAVALVLGAGTAEADTHGWAISDGSAGNWSDSSNWTPAGPPATADTVHFNDQGQTENITVDQDVTVANIQIKWDSGTILPGNTWQANLTDDGNGRTINITGGLYAMKAKRSSKSGNVPSARMDFTGLNLNIGTSSQRANLRAAVMPTDGGGFDWVKGQIYVDGGSVRAYLDTVILGHVLDPALNAADGLVNMQNCTDVMIDVAGSFILGDSDSTSTTSYQGFYNVGEFRAGGGSVTVSDDLILSDTRSGTSYYGHVLGSGSSGILRLYNTTFTVGGNADFNGQQWSNSGRTWEEKHAIV